MNFVFLDIANNYPFEFSAGNSKMEFMAKGLIEQGHHVHLFNSRSGYQNKFQKGIHQGISYYVFPKGGKIQYIKNFICQCKELKRIKEEKNNHVILASTFSLLFLFDILYCRLLGYKVSFLFHELRTTIRSQNSLFKKIDGWMCDNLACRFVNYIMPISHYLYTYAERFKKPMFIVPILADFTVERKIEPALKGQNYFAYCGNVGFLDVIDTLLSCVDDDKKIKLVLYGKSDLIEHIRQSTNTKGNIEILTNVPSEELNTIFDNALALFIPLDPNVLQDQIRFSQKIAEYVASHRPIITVRTGEIPYYFENGKNAFVMDNLTVEGLSAIMNDILDNPSLADAIGEAGFNVGDKYFSHIKVMKKLCCFLNNQVNNG